MATLQRAIEIAVAAHARQQDKGGGPYVRHPLRLMEAVDGEAAQIAAVLHDVAEDTAVTLDDLRAEGFPAESMEAVALLTHDRGVPYAQYVIRLGGNAIARAVKLADLRDNTRLDRLLLRPESIGKDLARIARYLLSYRYLTGGLTEAEYERLVGQHGAVERA